MTFPLSLSTDLGLAFAVLSGLGFGFVLERSGFGRAQKLVGQFYGYDMSVFKVMFTAVVTAMLIVAGASVVGLTDFKLIADSATSETFLVPFVVGGIGVGAGFVISGYCPGTSYVAMASGKVDGLVTVLGTIVGQLVWSELEWRPGFAAFHSSTNLGNVYLWQLLHLPDRAGPPILAAAVVAMAAACFVVAERVEKALGKNASAFARGIPGGRPRSWVLGGLAAAGVAGVAGLLLPTGTQAGVRQVEGVGAAELAQRVFDAPWTVRVVDVRPVSACTAKRVPGAECAPQAELAKLGLGQADPSRTLIVVSDAGGVPPEVEAYRGKLAVLRGGWGSWEEYALSPPRAPAPGAPAAELDAYRIRAGIQSALTGMKAAPPPPPPSAAPAGGGRKGGGGCSG
jgi:uncharacterized membrane protein YedE/YeeE